jgi:hypothetical protein
MSETSSKEVKSREPKTILRHLPQHAFAFRFYDQTIKTVKIDGEEEKHFGKQRNISPMYYPGGTSFTVEQIKHLPGDYKILVSNMEGNNWPLVVRTRKGNFQPLEKDDVIL